MAMIKEHIKYYLVLIFILFGIHQASSQQATPPQKWDLEGCINYALENNITVKQANLNKQTSELRYEQAKASKLPSLNASGSQSLTRGTSIDPITSEFLSQEIHSTSLGLNAQMTLYAGNQLNYSIQQNNLLLDQNSLYVEEAENSIVLDVTQAYLMAIYYKEGVSIAEANLEASEKQVEQTQALYEAGSVAIKELADIKSQYASDEFTYTSTVNSYNQQVLTLKQLLELEPEQDFEIFIPTFEEEYAVLLPEKMDVYQAALDIMPEIKAGELQKSVVELDWKIAKAGYLPTLSLNAGLSSGFTSTQRYNFSEQLDNNFNQRVGVTLSIPIFNKLQTKTSVSTAQLSKESARLDMIATKKALYQKVENAYQSAIASQSEMHSAKVQLEAAETAYNLTKQQFNVGILNTVDLLVSQNQYLTAQQNFTQTKYTLMLYYQLLQFYQGNPIKL
ncbi:TolC family protein [Flammeovirgaceae bacterium SG7u.111]|nr:TolC family protein [Flammeovirgaceae bacterium SG7u.132]WPO36552.1 TolC family protein [Flammeovirgaceae bacterium SG7u.111]